MFVWVPQPETIGRTSQSNGALAVFIDNPVIRSDGSQRVKLVLWSGESGGRAVALLGGVICATGTEHPLVFPSDCHRGERGHPPDKQLNAVNHQTIGNVVGKQGTGGKGTLSTWSDPGRTAPDTTLKKESYTHTNG
jgi:hypothetical protein